MPPKQPYYVRERHNKERIATAAIPIAILAIVANRVHVPWGFLWYAVAFCATYWVQDQTDPRFSQYQQYNAAFKRPRLKWWPEDGSRLTFQTCAIVSAVIATLICLIPQPLPGLSWPFLYAIGMAYSQGKRAEGFEDAPYPATIANLEGTHTLQRRIIFGISALIGAAIVVAAGMAMVHYLYPVKPSASTIKYLHYANVHLDHFRFGPLHMWQYVLLGLMGAIVPTVLLWAYLSETDQRAPWIEQQKSRVAWDQRWTAALKSDAMIPIYQGELKRPEMGETTHIKAVFQMQPGCDFSTYEKCAPKLASSLGPDMVLVEPMPIRGPDGMPIPGTRQALGFTVTYAVGAMGDRPWARADLDEQTLEFGVRWGFTNAFRELKLGPPDYSSLQVLAHPSDPMGTPLIETQWRLPQGLPYEVFVTKTAAIQEKLDVPWLRIGRRMKGNDWASELVSVVYGDGPDNPMLNRHDAQFLQTLQWEYAFRVCKLVGADGHMPEYRGSETTEMGLQAHSFGAAQGLPWEKVLDSRPLLVPTLRYRYIQVEPSDEAGGFRVICGDADPLDRMYLLRDWASQVIKTPTDMPQISFYPGIGADGTPTEFVFDDESPHLIVAGASGMGKSALLHTMVLQLATKNTPKQWELRIAEPKNELQRYKSLPHVTRFVDMRTPADNIFAPVADMLEELRIEMERRYELFLRLPTKPSKLEQAHQDPTLDEPLPYITCLIEECADYFVEPKQKEQKEDYNRLMYALEWLSRKARGAGIYLIVATQRPTKNNLPTQVKANSRKIGFGTSTMMDSMIIIDQAGLETIHTKGRGLISAFKGYRGFRGFFLDDSPGGKNDLARYLSPLQVLSEDRRLGPTADTSSQWPLAGVR